MDPKPKLLSINNDAHICQINTISTNLIQVKLSINSDSEYPIVDGKISIDCYLEAVKYCYTGLKQKLGGKNILRDIDYFCFHSPFYKMVQKAFTKMAQT